jgi:hypothetical protein
MHRDCDVIPRRRLQLVKHKRRDILVHCYTSLYLQGACGYGMLDKEKYPYWSVAALSTSSEFYKKGPVQGCG